MTTDEIVKPAAPVEGAAKLDPVQSTGLIDNAREQANRIEKQLDRKEALMKREEELEARKQLGGRSEGGSAPVVTPKKETDAEYAERVRRGEANPLKEDGFI